MAADIAVRFEVLRSVGIVGHREAAIGVVPVVGQRAQRPPARMGMEAGIERRSGGSLRDRLRGQLLDRRFQELERRENLGMGVAGEPAFDLAFAEIVDQEKLGLPCWRISPDWLLSCRPKGSGG